MRILYLFTFLTGLYLHSCHSKPSEKLLDAKTFYDQILSTEDAIIVDVRTHAEFESGYIDDAFNLDYNHPSFRTKIKVLEKNKPYFVYCLSGSRSGSAARLMREAGFQHVFELEGGILSWQKNDLPLIRKSTENVPDQISAEKYQNVISSDEMVVIDYYAPWCAPCKKMEPMLDQLAQDYQGKATIFRLNIDENKQLARQLGVEEIPILKIFRNGEEIWVHKGYIEKDDLIKAMGI